MKKYSTMLILLLLILGFSACGSKEVVDAERIFQVYSVNSAETKLIMNEHIMNAELTNQIGQVEELLNEMARTPQKLEYKPAFTMGFELLNYSLKEGNLILDVDEKYLEMSVATEVLVRASIVKTLTQVEGVKFVGFTIRGEALTDNLGGLLGLMNAESFIDSAGSQVDAMEEAKFKLYFTNEEGTGLVAVNRTIRYNTNIAIEKLIMEQLIVGPSDKIKGIYPTINPATKIISITVKDGICYLNLDDTFLTQIYNVSSEVTIYSIANTLVELPNVNKVQISINGKTDITYRENTSLDTLFERNLDLVSEPQ